MSITFGQLPSRTASQIGPDYQGHIFTDADDYRTPITTLATRLAQLDQGGQVFCVEAYRASGYTDDQAIQAAVTALKAASSSGGILSFDNRQYTITQTIDLDLTYGVIVESQSGPASTVGMANITYTPAMGSLLTAKSSIGLCVRDIRLNYTNASYNGVLVDLSRGSGGDTANVSFDRVQLYGTSGATGASALLLLRQCIVSCFANCSFRFAQVGVSGQGDSPTYTVNIRFDSCSFLGMTSSNVINAGTSWSFDDCDFQELQNGKCGAYRDDAGYRPGGLSFDNCWMGDASATGGTQIRFRGDGLKISGGQIGTANADNTPAILLGDDGTPSRGAVIQAVSFIAQFPLIAGTGTSGHVGLVVSGNDAGNPINYVDNANGKLSQVIILAPGRATDDTATVLIGSGLTTGLTAGLTVYDGSGIAVVCDASGRTDQRYTPDFVPSGMSAAGSACFSGFSGATGNVNYTIQPTKAGTTLYADLVLCPSGGVVRHAGGLFTSKTSAPADGDLANGEMAIWLDSTNGAAKLMVKAKQANGTVRTGSVSLS